MTLFCFFKISIKLKNSNITLTFNMLILSLPLKLEMNNLLSFLDIKIVKENKKFTTSVVCLLTFRVLYLIRTNTP